MNASRLWSDIRAGFLVDNWRAIDTQYILITSSHAEQKILYGGVCCFIRSNILLRDIGLLSTCSMKLQSQLLRALVIMTSWSAVCKSWNAKVFRFDTSIVLVYNALSSFKIKALHVVVLHEYIAMIFEQLLILQSNIAQERGELRDSFASNCNHLEPIKIPQQPVERQSKWMGRKSINISRLWYYIFQLLFTSAHINIMVNKMKNTLREKISTNHRDLYCSKPIHQLPRVLSGKFRAFHQRIWAFHCIQTFCQWVVSAIKTILYCLSGSRHGSDRV